MTRRIKRTKTKKSEISEAMSHLAEADLPPYAARYLARLVAEPTPSRVDGVRETTEVGTNPKDAFGDKKVDLNTIPSAALVFMAIAMKIGAIKYGIHNWRVSKVQARVYLGAARRHLLALIDGEDLDPSTGVHHAGFVMATIAIYLDAMVNGQLIDNRVLPGKTGELIEMFNELGHQATVADMRVTMQKLLGGLK